jgi:histidinol-phosphate aminotransferase
MDLNELLKPHLQNVKPYVPGKPIEELRRERNFEGEVVKLASNENPYPPVDEVRQAIIDELQHLNRYPNSGSYYLCRELADYHSVSPDQVFVGNGSNEIIDLLVRAFVNPDEEIVYPFPSFIVYPIVTQLAGVKAVEVPLRNYRIDLQAMKAGVTNKTKIVFICNPNNPTGTYVTQNEVEYFLDGLSPDVLVIFDEAYFEYVVADDFPDMVAFLQSKPNIIILRTFSKIHSLSGLRVGYSISNEDIVTCLHKVRQPFNVNRLAQIASRAALAHREKTFARVEENRMQMDYVRTELQKLQFHVPPSQTNFLLVIPPDGCENVIERLMDRGIIVRGMKPFGLGDEPFRVTIGTPEENKKFIEALQEIMK